MLLARINGWANGILRAALFDNTSTSGGALIGLTPSAAGLIISTICDNEAVPTVYTAAGATIDGVAALGTYVAPVANHCRLAQVDSTNHPGLYELQFLNTRFAVGGASYMIVTISASGFRCSPQGFLIDLGTQVDVRNFGGQPGGFNSGIPDTSVAQIGRSALAMSALLAEMLARALGTVTSAGFPPTATQFECSDITDADATPVYINRGFVVTSGAQFKSTGTITNDQVGASGRRFTTTPLPGGALANGDTICIAG